MPYKNLKQERFFHANKAKLESQGVNVSEWDKASKGKKLPLKKKSYNYKGKTLLKKAAKKLNGKK